MWTHRRYTWRYVPDIATDAEVLGVQVRAVLETVMEEFPQNFYNAEIRGMAFGVLEFEVVVTDRDQWWVGRRARILLEEFSKFTDVPLQLVSEEKVKKPAHMHRGARWLRARDREQGHA